MPPAAMDGPVTEAFLRAGRYLQHGDVSANLHSLHKIGGRQSDTFYRDLWSHDRVVRSTHGVNCTGSCSWKVYVKDGIITWEEQQTDYPTVGPDRPEYEPRGCPRGASFSWYTYSPARVRYPYVRGTLLEMYREERARLGDPVRAWEEITTDPGKRRRYQAARGMGGFVRATWDEAVEIIAAAHVNTIKKYGPDRIAGYSPLPAMSMVSQTAGARFVSLIGGAVLTFYDWHSDLPVASPQVFGDQTDVPESADWWDASYLMIWGMNVPVTRTPDAHWFVEARYRGQKVVAVSPDYSDAVKFADEWLPAQPGTDAALAMAMGHVILREFFVERETPRFVSYAKRFTDLPFLVTLRQRGDSYVPGKFLTAADLGKQDPSDAFKTVVLDSRTGKPAVPNGSAGFRYGEEGEGRWNLDLGEIDPLLSLYDGEDGGEYVTVDLPRFDVGEAGREGLAAGAGSSLRRGVPVRRVGDVLVTTVYDLLLAQYGVGRPGVPGTWPASYEDDSEPYTPAWQEAITSVSRQAAVRIAREFAQNAEDSGGRSMIIMGAGTNHWFHSDTIYRSFFTLLILTGCQGVNGGGWAHYTGQEKMRPFAGWEQLAFGQDWSRPPRQMISTAFWYLATSQWRYDLFHADALTSPLGEGLMAGQAIADVIAQSARLGWMPSYPTFNRNPLDLGDQEAAEPGKVVEELRAGRLQFASEDPDAPENWPRVLTVWRSNLIGSSAKGHEYFLGSLLGADSAVSAEQAQPGVRPRDVQWREEAPQGKLDLLTAIDFRMTSTGTHADVVLPAATWYEKHDMSCTDMHPFIHSFNPAISPPWQARTDFATFHAIARAFSTLAAEHLGVRRDLVAVPVQHDTPGEQANPGGTVRDWRTGECDPVPGVNLPRLEVVERDYGAIAEKMAALGPLVDGIGVVSKGVPYDLAAEVDYLRQKNGTVPAGAGAGRPSLARDTDTCEAILALSATTNGRLAVQGFEAAGAPYRHRPRGPRRRTGRHPDHLRRHPDRPKAGHHLAGVVRHRDRRTPLLAVHDQRGTSEAMAHADRAAALLPRP